MDAFFPFLKIQKPHGIMGDFSAILLIDGNFSSYKSFFDNNQKQYKIKIRQKPHSKSCIVKIDEINNRNLAEEFLKQIKEDNNDILYALKSERPALDQDECYLYDFKNKICYVLMESKKHLNSNAKAIEKINEITNESENEIANETTNEGKSAHGNKNESEHEITNETVNKNDLLARSYTFITPPQVVNMHNFGAGDMLEVYFQYNHNNQNLCESFYIPFNSDCFITIDDTLFLTDFGYTAYVLV